MNISSFLHSPSDFSQLIHMASALFPNEDPNELEDEYSAILSSSEQDIFMAKEGDACIGYIYVSLRSDYVVGADSSPVGYIEAMYVKESFRKQGVAKRLVKRAEKWASERGCKEMGSDTWDWKIDSQNFHVSIGFQKEETLVHFIKKIH